MRPITLYTTPYCGYCSAAKRLLSARGLAYTEVDVSVDTALRQRLSRENGGYQTVPMIFIGADFIGGYTDLSALDQTGALAERLNAP